MEAHVTDRADWSPARLRRGVTLIGAAADPYRRAACRWHLGADHIVDRVGPMLPMQSVARQEVEDGEMGTASRGRRSSLRLPASPSAKMSEGASSVTHVNVEVTLSSGHLALFAGASIDTVALPEASRCSPSPRSRACAARLQTVLELRLRGSRQSRPPAGFISSGTGLARNITAILSRAHCMADYALC